MRTYLSSLLLEEQTYFQFPSSHGKYHADYSAMYLDFLSAIVSQNRLNPIMQRAKNDRSVRRALPVDNVIGPKEDQVATIFDIVTIGLVVVLCFTSGQRHVNPPPIDHPYKCHENNNHPRVPQLSKAPIPTSK